MPSGGRQPCTYGSSGSDQTCGSLGASSAAQRRDSSLHATNGISASTESTTLFMLEIGLRAPGVEQVWQSLEALSHLSALQLCGMQLKREGLKRSSLANDVQKLLQQC